MRQALHNNNTSPTQPLHLNRNSQESSRGTVRGIDDRAQTRLLGLTHKSHCREFTIETPSRGTVCGITTDDREQKRPTTKSHCRGITIETPKQDGERREELARRERKQNRQTPPNMQHKHNDNTNETETKRPPQHTIGRTQEETHDTRKKENIGSAQVHRQKQKLYISTHKFRQSSQQ